MPLITDNIDEARRAYFAQDARAIGAKQRLAESIAALEAAGVPPVSGSPTSTRGRTSRSVSSKGKKKA